MSHNTPNTFQDDINRLVNAFLNRVEQLKMRLIYGVQVIRGTNNNEITFTPGGNIKINCDLELENNGIIGLNASNDTFIKDIGASTNLSFQSLYNSVIISAGANIALYAGNQVDLDSVIDMHSNKIISLATPTASTDAATKAYVDSVGGGGVTDHGALTGLGDDDHPQYMKELSEDTTPELSYNLNVNSHDLLYCNLLKFYDATGNNVLGTGSSGQIMAVSGANGSLLGYGSGGTVYAVVQASSTEVDISKKVDMNGNDIYGIQIIRGANGKELEFRSDGKLYYNDVEVGTGSGIWTDTGTVAKLSTARDIDLQGERVYLKNTGTDSTSVYYEVDTVNSKVKWHVPSGYSFDYTVG